MPLLTIAIPTYNRALYLHKCLISLKKSIPSSCQDIEILIINNNSTDNTEEIVEDLNSNINIKYIRNDSNIGADENFKKCLKEANGNFVWIFGDDDIFFENSISYILNIIKNNNEIGLIHLKAKNFQLDDELMEDKIDSFDYKVISSKEDFIKIIHTNITFLSANIFNKKLLNNVDLDAIPNNNLGQVYWNMVCILEADKNIFCNNKIFGARQFNSGNYNFCKVFVVSFIDILNLIDIKYNIKNILKIFYKRLLIFYYPANIIRLKNGLSGVEYNNNCFNLLYPKFKFNIYFWIFTIPAIILPKKVSLYIIKLIEKNR